MGDCLTVKFFTVERELPDINCDSVRIPVSDNCKGEFSGVYGIRRGHAKSVFSLKPGKVTVSENGRIISEIQISDGFALVDNNVVRITVDKIESGNICSEETIVD